MTSRAAFEAWCRAEGVDTTLWLKDHPQCGYANARTTDYWVGWQAAIQHAREVAVKECERVAKDYNSLDPAEDCAAAIKEALK